MTAPGLQRFKLLTPEELDALSDPSWLIHGVIPRNGFCVLYGDPGCGKTFVALSQARSVAAGHSWCGRKTVADSVLYIAAEGLAGIRLRSRAYQKKHQLVSAQIRYFGHGLNLLDHTHVQNLLTVFREDNFQPRLIVIDTLARVMVGGDENSARDMGLVISNIDELRHPTSATVIVVHHSRKNGNSERGSSALRGAADVMIECTGNPGDGLVTLSCEKMKDAEPFKRASIGLERIALGPSLASLAVTTWKDALESTAAKSTAHKIMETLEKEFGLKGATHGEWLKACMGSAVQSKSSFERALDSLKQEKAVQHDGTKYYPNRADGVGVTPVSPGVIDTAGVGVVSPPPLGGDT